MVHRLGYIPRFASLVMGYVPQHGPNSIQFNSKNIVGTMSEEMGPTFLLPSGFVARNRDQRQRLQLIA